MFGGGDRVAILEQNKKAAPKGGLYKLLII
jgi:hypothetical protein